MFHHHFCEEKHKLTVGQAFHCWYHPIWHVLWMQKEKQSVSNYVLVGCSQAFILTIVNQCIPALFSNITMPVLFTLKMLWTMCLPFTYAGFKTPSNDIRPNTLCKLNKKTEFESNIESSGCVTAGPRVLEDLSEYVYKLCIFKPNLPN